MPRQQGGHPDILTPEGGLSPLPPCLLHTIHTLETRDEESLLTRELSCHGPMDHLSTCPIIQPQGLSVHSDTQAD